MNEAEQQAYGDKVARVTADPVIVADMVRHLAAIETMICGRPGHLATGTEPLFVAGMKLTPGELNLLMCATGRDGRDLVYVHFDADQPDEPRGIAVIRNTGDFIAVHPACRVWAPARDGRAVIVPIGEEAEGQFSFRTGRQLQHSANRPADALEGGFRRAQVRMRRLTASGMADDSVAHAKRQSTTCLSGGRLEFRAEPIAA